MTPLRIALIEKTGWNNGFEHVVSSDMAEVVLGSAQHRARASVTQTVDHYQVHFSAATPALLPELKRLFTATEDALFLALDEQALADLLRRAARLAKALPNQAVKDYEVAVAKELAALPAEIKGTEVERMVCQRVGQQGFRQAQMDYWGGACAVTGIAIPEVLRASHAKPWAECASDAERLDVFNGFLLSANLDALFDRFLISFDEAGRMLVSEGIASQARERLSISQPLRLRWLAVEHLRYLGYHRLRFMSEHG